MSEHRHDNRWAASLRRRECSLISVLSGKGGVGKSVISFNVAERLSAAGHRVLIVDADFNGGNQHILANLDCPCGLAEFASGQLALSEAVTPIDDNLDLLAMSDLPVDTDLVTTGRAAELTARLRAQSSDYDFVIIDHGSGVSEAAVVMAHAADRCLLVTVPELTAISNVYGLYKHLVQANDNIDCRLVINWVQGEFEAPYISGKIRALAQRFLGHAPSYLGSLPEDEAVRRSIAAQAPLASAAPQAPITEAFEQLTQVIVNPTVSSPTELAATDTKQINTLPAAADNGE